MPHGLVNTVDDWSKYMHGLYSEATVFYFLQVYRYLCEVFIISCHSSNCWCPASSEPCPEHYYHLHMSHSPFKFNTKCRPKFGWNYTFWMMQPRKGLKVSCHLLFFLSFARTIHEKWSEVPRDLDSCLVTCNREILERESKKQSWLEKAVKEAKVHTGL